MTKKIQLSLAVLFILVSIGFSSYGQIPSQITAGLKSGNAKMVAGCFNSNVELVILDKENVCTREQGEMILSDFFSRNKPIDFKITHQGGADSAYGIGKMECAGSNFRIYFMLKNFNGKALIVQLRIEKDQ